MRTEKSRAREKDLCAVKGTLSRHFCCNFDQNSTENKVSSFVHKMLLEYQNENVNKIVKVKADCNSDFSKARVQNVKKCNNSMVKKAANKSLFF